MVSLHIIIIIILQHDVDRWILYSEINLEIVAASLLMP